MAESMSVCASSMQGACTLSSLKAMHSAHETLDAGRTVSRVAPNGCRMVVRAAGSQKGGVNPVKPGTNQPGTLQGGGTRYVGGKKVKAIELFGDKSGKVRDKIRESPEAIKILSRVEQLRLLSKAEKAGLLTTVENLGFSLSKIESLGLLSKAEELGVLSAATNPATPGALLTTALALLLLGPVFVYFVPETSTPLIVLQVIIAAISVVGGSAAFGASNFVSTLQNSE